MIIFWCKSYCVLFRDDQESLLSFLSPLMSCECRFKEKQTFVHLCSKTSELTHCDSVGDGMSSNVLTAIAVTQMLW